MTGVIRGDHYFIDGCEVTKAQFDLAFPDLGAPLPRIKGRSKCAVLPKLSDALAVHPRQVKEAIESSVKKGVPTDFAADGRPVIRSRAHQKAYLKAYGFHNKDGGYGD